MKVNIGCGAFYVEGWVNVDTHSDERVTPDIVASAVGLPLVEECADFVYMGHVLEHLPSYEVVAALNEAHRILKPRGILYVVGPDHKKAIKADDTEAIRGIEEGGREWPGDEHHWTCDTATLLKFLLGSDFTKIVLSSPGLLQKDGAPVTSLTYWQCAFRCEK